MTTIKLRQTVHFSSLFLLLFEMVSELRIPYADASLDLVYERYLANIFLYVYLFIHIVICSIMVEGNSAE